MAKTVFAALMQIPSTFLNKIFAHRHDGLDQDGSAPLDYAADSGAADAYVATLSPALTQYVIGMPIRYKAINANTGASTVNINGLGVTAIKKNVSEALVAGDIQAGQIVTVVYDGTNFQLENTVIGGLLGDLSLVYSGTSAFTSAQCTTDGIVMAYKSNAGNSLIGSSDANNPPTTIVVRSDTSQGASECITFVAKKGNYYKVDPEGYPMEVRFCSIGS